MAEHAQRLQDSRVFVAGHRGLVGSAIVRRLEKLGCRNLLVRSRSELDLREQGRRRSFFPRAQAGICILGGGESWRDSGERYSPR